MAMTSIAHPPNVSSACEFDLFQNFIIATLLILRQLGLEFNFTLFTSVFFLALIQQIRH